MSDLIPMDWRIRQARKLRDFLAPVDEFANEYVRDPLNKAIPGRWGDNLAGLLDLSKELSPGMDIKDQEQGLIQIKDGVLAGDCSTGRVHLNIQMVIGQIPPGALRCDGSTQCILAGKLCGRNLKKRRP